MRLIPIATSSLLASALSLCALAASAQEPAPAETAAPAPPPPAAEPAPAPAPVPAAGAVPAPEAAPTEAAPMAPEAAPAAPAEEETFPAAWFRIDSDGSALQLWAGATHMLSDSVGIATDMYVNSGFLGEFDLGPAFTAGPFTVTPMLGLQVNWHDHRADALVPQLYVIGGPSPIYMELWVQNYENGVFDKSGKTTDGGGNTLYFRYFVDYMAGKYIGVGPEAELLLGLNSKSKNGDKSLLSLPVGLNVSLTSYGKNNSLVIFGGYETQDTENDKHLAGRLTFVHNF